MLKMQRLGHVVIKVADLARSCAFYTEVLGMQVMNDSSGAGLLFLANGGRDHHELALLEVGARDGTTGCRDEGFGPYRVPARIARRAGGRLPGIQGAGSISFTCRHGITDSVYFFDPDGHELEVYCDNPEETFRDMPNSYLGMEKLEFAAEDAGLAHKVREYGIAPVEPDA